MPHSPKKSVWRLAKFPNKLSFRIHFQTFVNFLYYFPRTILMQIHSEQYVSGWASYYTYNSVLLCTHQPGYANWSLFLSSPGWGTCPSDPNFQTHNYRSDLGITFSATRSHFHSAQHPSLTFCLALSPTASILFPTCTHSLSFCTLLLLLLLLVISPLHHLH